MTESQLHGPSYDDIQAAIGTPTLFNWAVNIDPGHRFVYFENPKVACSTIKATLNRAIAAREGIALSYASMTELHDRRLNPMTNPWKVGPPRFEALMRDPAVFRFTYVRDPYRRFCSAYLSKIRAKALGVKPVGRRLAEALGLDPEAPLSLEDFAALVTGDQALRDFDPHWRLQRDQVAFDRVDYSYIGRHDHFDASFPLVLERLFPGERVQLFDSREAFGRRTASQALADELSPAMRRRIEAAYAADFEMLEAVAARYGAVP